MPPAPTTSAALFEFEWAELDISPAGCCELEGCESIAGSDEPVASPTELALPPGRFRSVEPLPVSASVMTLCLMILVMPCAETVVAVVYIACIY